MRTLIGIYAAVAGLILAGMAIMILYILFARPMSYVGRVEGVLASIFLLVCLYFLFRFTRYTFGNSQSLGWQKSEAYAVLILGVVVYGGTIPWGIYMVINDLKLWPVLIICTPIYCGLVLLLIRAFRYQMKVIKSEINQG